MIKRYRIIWGIFLLFLPTLIFAQGRELKGQVLLVGVNDEPPKPAVGVEVTLVERGDTVRTKAQGLFRLFLADVFKAGEKITLAVDYFGWRIQYPLDGEVRIPADLDRDIVKIWLLPAGSKKFWTDDRIEKFIQDTAEKAKQQVRLEGKPGDIDFSRYIKEWAVKYGFSAEEAKAEIDKWVAEVQKNQDDLYKLGLAAFAEKNFGKASELFTESARAKAKRLETLDRERETLKEETVRDYRLAGDAAYNNYAFGAALDAYQKALNYVSKEERPSLWAAIFNDIGNTHEEIGIRASGSAAHKHLNAALAAFRNNLQVIDREHLPQDWAMTQNNLGVALAEQGQRSKGEEGRRLLGEAVEAYRNALQVFTGEHLPQQWAMTQHNLGETLRNQGERSGGEEGRRLLGEAVEAFRNALQVRTREHLPQGWAATQNNLGGALVNQGERSGGEEGRRLLGEAVAAFRNALQVFTREHLPQDWATTQNNLGLALAYQGERSGGEEGRRLLGEAVAAYRNALQVFTREHLPQGWATTQNNLGTALVDQSQQAGGEEGRRLLGEAVEAFRNALQVRTREHLPQYRAMTQNNLVKAYLLLEDWPNAAASCVSLLSFDPDYRGAYYIAHFLYHEKLFEFAKAFALNQYWLKQHPEDLSVQINFAEVHFTTGRFTEAKSRLAALLTRSDLELNAAIALQALEIATLLALNETDAIAPKLKALRERVIAQPDAVGGWTFAGTRHFISQHENLASHAWLLNMLTAIEEKDRDALLMALQAAQSTLQAGRN